MTMTGELEFGGEEHFAARPERVFDVITDLDLLAQHIPDIVSANRLDEHTLECIVRPGFAFLRGTMRMTIQLTELVRPRSACMRIDASGIGQTIRIVSRSLIEPEGAGALLRWQAQVVERRGLVATISKALIQAAAGQVIRDAWQKVHRHVEQ
jgi:carbon monoxide dehydrogenase subunit G